jgi:hypothetical protein
MKKIGQKNLLVAAVLLLLVFSCKKNIPEAVLKPGSSALTASASTVVLDSTGGGSKMATTLSWPPVSYGAQVAVTNVLQIDSINGNFSKPVSVNLATGVTMSYTMSALNTVALSLGLAPGVAGQLQARVVTDVNQSTGAASSVSTVYSNVIKLTLTPYSTIPQPKYPVPLNLFLVGNATPGGTATGWNNPVPVPSQQFTQIDPNTFGIVINLIGGAQFLLLPVNGDWSHKYAVTSSNPNAGGDAFVPDAANNMNGPATSGLYKIIVDFVKGTYTITPAGATDIPTSLFLVGDATAGAWADPVPVPSQQFTQVSSGEFKIIIPLLGSGSYLFLPVNTGSYNIKYGGASATGGPLLENGTVPGSNTPNPGAAGTYTIDVNFFSNTYKVSK